MLKKGTGGPVDNIRRMPVETERRTRLNAAKRRFGAASGRTRERLILIGSISPLARARLELAHNNVRANSKIVLGLSTGVPDGLRKDLAELSRTLAYREEDLCNQISMREDPGHLVGALERDASILLKEVNASLAFWKSAHQGLGLHLETEIKPLEPRETPAPAPKKPRGEILEFRKK